MPMLIVYVDIPSVIISSIYGRVHTKIVDNAIIRFEPGCNRELKF